MQLIVSSLTAGNSGGADDLRRAADSKRGGARGRDAVGAALAPR